MSQEFQDNTESQVTLKSLILRAKEWSNYILGKWLVLFIAGVIGGGIGFIYAYLQKPNYTASLSFVLEDEKSSNGGGLSGLASQFGFDIGGGGGGAFTSGNLVELMKSRYVVEKTLMTPVKLNGSETSLAEYYIDFKGWRRKEDTLLKKIKFLPNADRSTFSLQMDSILGNIYESLINVSLNISQKDKKASIISIDVRTENQGFSKAFAEALAETVSAFYIDTKSKKAQMNLAVLQKQTDSIRSELNDALTGVASANDNIYNLNPALNVKRVPSSKRQIDVQANTAILTQLVQNLELAKVSLRKETPLIQIIDRPILPLKKDKVGKLKSLIIGGIIMGLLTLIVIVIRRLWEKIML